MPDDEVFSRAIEGTAAGATGKASSGDELFTNIVRLAVVDSTNRYIVDAARAGAAEGLVVVADEQEAGRGRRGRTWVAPPGSALLCSILFRPVLPIDEWHLVTSIVALSAIDAIATTTSVSVSLKWPNDLVMGSTKLAGILAESVSADEADIAPAALCVGIGINLSWPQGFLAGLDAKRAELLADAATLESLTDVHVERDLLLDLLLASLRDRYRSLLRSEGRVETMEKYRKACSTIGSLVLVSELGRAWRGEAIGVSDGGRLLVRRDGEIVELNAADVVHLRPAPRDRTF